MSTEEKAMEDEFASVGALCRVSQLTGELARSLQTLRDEVEDLRRHTYANEARIGLMEKCWENSFTACQALNSRLAARIQRLENGAAEKPDPGLKELERAMCEARDEVVLRATRFNETGLAYHATLIRHAVRSFDIANDRYQDARKRKGEG